MKRCKTYLAMLLSAAGVVHFNSASAGSPGLDDLFRAYAVGNMHLSPGGDWIALRKGDEVLVGNPEVGFVTAFTLGNAERVADIEWVGESSVSVSTYLRTNGNRFLHAFQVPGIADGNIVIENLVSHELAGFIVDPLLDEPNHVVIAKIEFEDDFVATELYRTDLFGNTKSLFRKRNRLDVGKERFFYYLDDENGDFLAGVRYVEGVPQLWTRSSATEKWTLAWEGSEDTSFHPYAVRGDRIVARTNAFTDTTAAVEVDAADGSLVRVLYQHDFVDIDGIVLDSDARTPVGVRFRQAGLVQYTFLTDSSETTQLVSAVSAQFPNQSVILLGQPSSDGTVLAAVGSSTNPGLIYRCRNYGRDCLEFEKLAPWLDETVLNPSMPLLIDSSDGFRVESFLTIPQDADGAVPLIVIPHGGPIGVRDDRHFSGEVQWLSLNGYAVLQVNFRGSGGYGQEFMQAGLRELGRGIEDDVENATLFVLENYPQLDRDRVGIFGGSYGGYSALMSTIRRPDLFKCAASWAGVTDLPLLFSAADLRVSEGKKRFLDKLIGDREGAQAEQMEFSPVYQFEKLTRPVFLGHGTLDLVVDIEHSWRLDKLMKMSGGDSTLFVLEGTGHGFRMLDEVGPFYRRLLEFFNEHLSKTHQDATS